MLELKDVSFRYEEERVLKHINLQVDKGQVVLLTGPSGCGKSTILRLINGLIPHYYQGELQGEIWIQGQPAEGKEIHDLSALVGTVFQNPRTQFFNVDTDSELAFGLENQGVGETEILRRMEESVVRFHMEGLMGKSLFRLSGGEKQKVACASVDVTDPEIILLDEPSANLDYSSILLLRQAIELWKSLGKTILIADHRIAYLTDLISRIIIMRDGEIIRDMPGEWLISLTEAEREGLGIRGLIFENPVDIKLENQGESVETYKLKNLDFRYKASLFGRQKRDRLKLGDIDLAKGKITVIAGANGRGKSTLLRLMAGLEKSYKSPLRGRTFMVMQDVNHQLFTDSVREEIGISGEGSYENLEMIDKLMDRHPMSLSGGEKQRVAIACALASRKEVLLFDEPTSGLDYGHMVQVADLMKQLKNMGRTLVVVTHDTELIHLVADRIICL